MENWKKYGNVRYIIKCDHIICSIWLGQNVIKLFAVTVTKQKDILTIQL